MPSSFKRTTTDNIPIPTDIVGSSTFGRDNKIQSSRTYNLLISDDWLVDTYGYAVVKKVSPDLSGRGIFSSVRGEFILAVVGNKVLRLTPTIISGSPLSNISAQEVGQIDTFTGDVFIAENNANQIAICDKSELYIYNYITASFESATLPDGVIPGYVTYQTGYFIIVDLLSSSWYLSDVNNGLSWFWGVSGTPVSGDIQTKPDKGAAAVRISGKGNLLFVMGTTVTEQWTSVPSPIFPYQRSTSSNIDYGCINPATISSSDELTAWLGGNEKSGPVILFSDGNTVSQISTDGYNFLFSNLKNPTKSSAFFMKISGHLIYQITFYDPDDNVSLIYDFTTKKFFDVTDENMDYHPLREVAYFKDRYYSISFNDGNIYQITENIPVYDYADRGSFEIPRIRICSNIRSPNQLRFSATNFSFILEQGNDPEHIVPDPSYQPRIALSISKDGGYEFSSYVSKPVSRLARRQRRLVWWNLGSMNDLVLQLRFFSRGQFRAADGLVNLWQ